jgi:hypothetical protein
VAKEVCEILGLSNPTIALKSLDDDERAKFNLGQQGKGNVNIVNEPSLYSLILRLRKPRAKAFKRWIETPARHGRASEGEHVQHGFPHVTGFSSLAWYWYSRVTLFREIPGRPGPICRQAHCNFFLVMVYPAQGCWG